MTRQERVIVISPRKSGTHLIQRLLTKLGYGIWGDVAAPASSMPALSIRDRLALADQTMTESERATLDPRNDMPDFVRRTNQAWLELAGSWAHRLGAHSFPGTGGAHSGHEHVTQTTLHTATFARTPPNICWIYHSLDIWRMDPRFALDWHEHKRPAIILNVRDPRDAIVSFANFLGGATGRAHRKIPEAQFFTPAYSRVESLAERIAMILTDPVLPFVQDYERAVAFYRHPDVCNVSFEELVGPAGGGTDQGQQKAIVRVAGFLGASCDPAEIAPELFDRNSFTFHKGQVGVWRSALGEPQRTQVTERLGGLAEALGYR